MRHHTALLIGAVALLAGVLAALQPAGAIAYGWIATSFWLVAAAYAFDRADLFGKGRWWRIPSLGVLLPFLLFTWLAWLVGRRRSRPADEIVPGVWLASWPLRLPAGIERVVDLTAEFPRPPGTRDLDYRLVATLDKTAPMTAPAAQVVAALIAEPRPTVVHCAMGHGRSATVVAAYLIARGDAADVAQAVALMRAARPNVGLSPAQRAAAETIAAAVAAG